MKHRSLLLIVAVAAATYFTSCVPSRKYEEEQAKRKAAEADLQTVKDNNQKNETKITELNNELTDVQKRVTGLQNDTNVYGTSIRLKTLQYNQLLSNYELLLKQNKDLLARNADENTKLVGQLNMTQEELFKKQDELKKKEADLNALQASLDQTKTELAAREARIKELEDILKKKDDAIADIKKKVSDALTSFVGKGLTVTQKNGKIYVSMEESLLFSSGSWKVQSKGEDALKSLAKVLEQNPDVSVLVEGHTDDVPLKGSGDVKDNWDLSVMRATSVVKILVTNGPGIKPERLAASGRGEFVPVDPAKTADARAKNRRTEIILTPKLDELFKVLDSN